MALYALVAGSRRAVITVRASSQYCHRLKLLGFCLSHPAQSEVITRAILHAGNGTLMSSKV